LGSENFLTNADYIRLDDGTLGMGIQSASGYTSSNIPYDEYFQSPGYTFSLSFKFASNNGVWTGGTASHADLFSIRGDMSGGYKAYFRISMDDASTNNTLQFWLGDILTQYLIDPYNYSALSFSLSGDKEYRLFTTYKDTGTELYIKIYNITDDIIVQESTEIIPMFGPETATGTHTGWYLGGVYPPAQNPPYFTGKIQDVYVSNTILTWEEVSG